MRAAKIRTMSVSFDQQTPRGNVRSINNAIGFYNRKYAMVMNMLFCLTVLVSNVDRLRLAERFHKSPDPFARLSFVTDLLLSCCDAKYLDAEWVPLEWRCRIMIRFRLDLDTSSLSIVQTSADGKMTWH